MLTEPPVEFHGGISDQHTLGTMTELEFINNNQSGMSIEEIKASAIKERERGGSLKEKQIEMIIFKVISNQHLMMHWQHSIRIHWSVRSWLLLKKWKRRVKNILRDVIISNVGIQIVVGRLKSIHWKSTIA